MAEVLSLSRTNWAPVLHVSRAARSARSRPGAGLGGEQSPAQVPLQMLMPEWDFYNPLTALHVTLQSRV